MSRPELAGRPTASGVDRFRRLYLSLCACCVRYPADHVTDGLWQVFVITAVYSTVFTHESNDVQTFLNY